MLRVLNVCGARPNFMKVAPLMKAYHASAQIEPYLIHTGQHYDENMSKLFFQQLRIPEPDINLEVGSGSHAAQTARIMMEFEPVLLQIQPDWVVVVGDVNSTIACALVSIKLGFNVAHVEAGLRSFDRSMPEEINRLLTDAVSNLLFVSEPSGVKNLRQEGIPSSKIRFVGNTMVDTLLEHRDQASHSDILERLQLEPQQYALVTLHRPSNVDHCDTLRGIVEGLMKVSEEIPIVFAVHPRTGLRLKALDLYGQLASNPNIRLTDPLGYLDFLKLMSESRLVMTDSGGIQEETTILGMPCFTLRRNTERPVTIEQGTNRLIDLDQTSIPAAWQGFKLEPPKIHQVPKYWDGKAAKRIVEALLAGAG